MASGFIALTFGPLALADEFQGVSPACRLSPPKPRADPAR